MELCKYFALYIHVLCCHCTIVHFNAVRSFDRKSEINHQFSTCGATENARTENAAPSKNAGVENARVENATPVRVGVENARLNAMDNGMPKMQLELAIDRAHVPPTKVYGWIVNNDS